jgi:hypothetical protein
MGTAIETPLKGSYSIKSLSFSEFHPPLKANVLFLQVFLKNLTLCMTKLKDSGAVFFLLYG